MIFALLYCYTMGRRSALLCFSWLLCYKHDGWFQWLGLDNMLSFIRSADRHALTVAIGAATMGQPHMEAPANPCSCCVPPNPLAPSSPLCNSDGGPAVPLRRQSPGRAPRAEARVVQRDALCRRLRGHQPRQRRILSELSCPVPHCSGIRAKQ